MGATVKCPKCKTVNHYDEMQNIGTLWHPIWSVICSNCGHQITLKVNNSGLAEMIDKSFIRLKKVRRNEDRGLIFEHVEEQKKNGYERAKSSDIREYWIQEYIRDNYKKLGVSRIEGPLETGPDFLGVLEGREVTVEVERDCQSFIYHKHHENKRFGKVDTLIVLNPSKPSQDIKDKLPTRILYIDIDDFVAWWEPKARNYAKKKEKQRVIVKIQTIVELVTDEFRRRYFGRYIEHCSDKNRDMSTCPICDSCPYFDEMVPFGQMALRFLALYKYPIVTEDFNISIIKPSEIDAFYEEFVQQSY